MSRNSDSSTEEILAELSTPAWSSSPQDAPSPRRSGSRNTNFYHGTGRVLSPGDHILPWSRLKESGLVEGEAPHGGAHMSWAATTHGKASAYGQNVYKVRPLGDHEELPDGRVRTDKGFEVISDGWEDL